MKKKELYIIIIIAIVSIVSIICMTMYHKKNIINRAEKETYEENQGEEKPQGKPKGYWVGIVYHDTVIKWFDSGIDAKYTVSGDVGKITVEVKNGKWHVCNVDCPNHNCERMGWADKESFFPIQCIPNGIYIATEYQLLN